MIPSSAAPDVMPSPASLAWIKRLIAFDTTSRNSNLELIDHVRAELERLGLDVTLTFNAKRTKANLFATLPATCGTRAGGVILSGHSDVVPVDGQDWSSDPFAAEIRGDRLYGRGACDMKGFVGVALGIIPELTTAKLAKPVHVALSFDEEVGCLGAPIMIDDLVARGVHADACIVGEPTEMQPVVAHKSIRLLRCRVRGSPAHSSRPYDGVNAITYSGRIVAFISERAESLQRSVAYDAAFDPPYTTMTVNQIGGGTAPNVVPEHCSFVFEYRSLPGGDPLALQEEVEAFIETHINPEIARHHPASGADLEVLVSVPAFEADSALARRVGELTCAEARKVGYSTEAGQFQLAGIPTIVCGPGSIEQAHKADEWVSLAQLAKCEAFLRQITRDQSSSPTWQSPPDLDEESHAHFF